MVRPPASTSYNPNSNTVDIKDENDLFDENNKDNGVTDFRSSALVP